MSREMKANGGKENRPKSEANLQVHMLGPTSDLQIPVDVSGCLYSKNALVGLFDFLGFKQVMSSSRNLLDTAARFKWISLTVRNSGEKRTRFDFRGKVSDLIPEVIQVSDTFMVYSPVREPQNVIQFLWNVHHMLFYSILYGFPLRGALATGEIVTDKNEKMFLGPAILEALDAGKQQNWSGACIAASLHSYIDEIGIQGHLFPLVLPYDVPLKDQTVQPKPRLSVNWIADVASYIAPEWVRTKFPPFQPNSPEEVKVHNTEKFLTFAVEQKLKHGPYSSPKNRKVILESDVIPGGRIVRFVLDENKES